ncbi:MAG TPA: hypothetical protein VFV55_00900 [Usitatibacteraceae bacterium]|nr:hypothetical protein [Usitatibacteraceae bacterium]
MAHLTRSFLVGFLLCLSFVARAADPVAFVSDIRGDVVMTGAGRPPFLAELLPGSRLVLGSEASAAVMYVVSGEEFTLEGPGEFVVTGTGVKAITGPAPSRRSPALRVSASVVAQSSRTATASLRMRSAPVPKAERTGPLYPVNARIATLQPTLRWSGEAGTTYTVVVTSAAGKEVFRGGTKGPSLRLPSRLVAGQGYSWTYSAATAAPGDSRFETLASDAIATAEKARSAAKTFADRVLLALVLQDLGAAQDAREVWAQLAAERPDIPELAGLSR